MAMLRFAPLALTLPLLAGCTANAMENASDQPLSERDQRRMEAMIGDRVPGEPVNCIPLRPTTQSSIIGNRMVLYRNGPVVYANDFDGVCPTLRSDATLVVDTVTSQLCSGDIAQIRDPHSGVSFGSCVFGEFVPYRPPE
jgi:hypothetical protein